MCWSPAHFLSRPPPLPSSTMPPDSLRRGFEQVPCVHFDHLHNGRSKERPTSSLAVSFDQCGQWCRIPWIWFLLTWYILMYLYFWEEENVISLSVFRVKKMSSQIEVGFLINSWARDRRNERRMLHDLSAVYMHVQIAPIAPIAPHTLNSTHIGKKQARQRTWQTGSDGCVIGKTKGECSMNIVPHAETHRLQIPKCDPWK